MVLFSWQGFQNNEGSLLHAAGGNGVLCCTDDKFVS
jgi:hypothetical protein